MRDLTLGGEEPARVKWKRKIHMSSKCNTCTTTMKLFIYQSLHILLVEKIDRHICQEHVKKRRLGFTTSKENIKTFCKVTQEYVPKVAKITQHIFYEELN